MTRPGSGRVGSLRLKYHGSGRVGSRGSKISRVGSGRVRRSSKSRGSGRFGSKGFKIFRVGSGRVKRFSKSRGSGRVMTREYGSLAGQAIMTRELFAADPRVEPADLACGFAFFSNLYISACRWVLVVPAPRGSQNYTTNLPFSA